MTHSKTKIVCTIGPSSNSVENLVKLIDCGMDIARLNFSHGSYDQHRDAIANIREASGITGKPIAIMQDLQGPKIRVANFENGSAILTEGAEFTITTDMSIMGNENIVATTYDKITEDVRIGNTLLLDDGYLILEIINVTRKEIITKVIKGGVLKSHKGIICQGNSFSAPAMSDKDVEDLKFGLSCDVDAVALSYVRSVRDIFELKTAMKIFGKVVGVVAKIERPEALDVIDEIIDEADAIMIARGDLGLEMPPELVPIVQKDIIAKCNCKAKPVITATQMLESMITNPRPTRAEASDVANSVFDGTDAVMLSAETSVGDYPFESVQYMNKITKTVEDHILKTHQRKAKKEHEVNELIDGLGNASVMLAEQINATAIVTLTTNTMTAKSIAKYRPGIPIIGLTNDPKIQRRLNFVWGCDPVLIEAMALSSEFEKLSDFLIDKHYINKGDLVVFVSGEEIPDSAAKQFIRVYSI